jgi:hypothetical protein
VNVPYLEHAAIVHGRIAGVVADMLGEFLVSPRGRMALAAMGEAERAELVGVLRACELAGSTWQRRQAIADSGNGTATTATRVVVDRARSEGEVLTVVEVMGRFGVKERQARNIAAVLGRKERGRWLVDADAVAGELARRGAA